MAGLQLRFPQALPGKEIALNWFPGNPPKKWPQLLVPSGFSLSGKG